MLRVSDSGLDAPKAPGDEWIDGRDADLDAGVSAVIDRHVAIACADGAGRLTFVNRAFCRLSGHPREELLGQDHRLLDGGREPRAGTLELCQTLARGETWTGELEYRSKDGRQGWVAATVAPVGAGTHAGTRYVCICSDITEMKRRALSDVSQYQEQQRQSDEQYAHAASHDLQEPLRAIVSCGQMLEQDFGASVDPTAMQLIEHMIEGGKRMQRLVLDLLAYARAGTQSPRLMCASSQHALAQALAQLETSIRESGAQVDAQGLPVVLADPQQLVELFQHLASNALAYHAGNRPLIRVRAERDGTFWRFSLSDNGIGIDPQSHRRIFSLFQRLEARHTVANRGLGLPLCKRIVERHGGRIWVESERGRGSTFFFTLPAPLSPAAEKFE
jgi:PAS domain S-box-containing protein